MNRARWNWVKSVLAVCLLLALPAPARPQSFRLYSATNMIPTNGVPPVGDETAINPVLPVVAMTNVPLSRGIRRLLRQSRMQADIDLRLKKTWRMTDAQGRHILDPAVNFRWTNLTARAALRRLLRDHHLAMEEEPASMHLLITYADSLNASGNKGWFNGGANKTNLIQFRNVPIRVAFDNLSRAGGFNYAFDREIGYGEMDWYGNIIPEPSVTMTVNEAAPRQVFAALCAQHRLDLTRDPQTGIVFVRYPGHNVDFVDPEIYGADTNVMPVISFKEVPLSTALKNLARQAGLKCIFSPRIDTGHPGSEPRVNLGWRNITAGQAFAAICENYDLDVTKYPVSGFIRVEPNN